MTGKTTLYYGANGDEVKELQQYLNKNGYNLAVDGGFGEKTLSAVKDYQQKNGLTVDGIVGSNTWGSLLTFTAPTLNGTSYTATDEGKTNKSAMDTALTNLNNYGANWQYAQTNKDILEEYLGREPFSYDLNGDALYQQYKDKYIQQGKMAMQDTMGQAAAMTGGYGNSYAQSAGQQAYQNSLDNLNDIVPELYQMAYDRYNQQGQDMINKLSVLDADYNRGYTAAQDKYGIARDNFYNAADLYGSEVDRANSISQQDWQNAMTIYNAKEEKKNNVSGGTTYGTSKSYTKTIDAGDGTKTTKVDETGYSESAADYADWDYGDWEGYFATIRNTKGKSAAETELSRMTKLGYIPKEFTVAAGIGARGSLGH